MNYRAAYDEALRNLLPRLSEVDSFESALHFNAYAARMIQTEAAKTLEFYPGEFLNILRLAFERESRVVMDACQREISDVKTEADRAKLQLAEHLNATRSANDHDAEHAVWQTSERIKSKLTAKMDAASKRIAEINIRMKAFTALMKAFGLDVPTPDRS